MVAFMSAMPRTAFATVIIITVVGRFQRYQETFAFRTVSAQSSPLCIRANWGTYTDERFALGSCVVAMERPRT